MSNINPAKGRWLQSIAWQSTATSAVLLAVMAVLLLQGQTGWKTLWPILLALVAFAVLTLAARRGRVDTFGDQEGD